MTVKKKGLKEHFSAIEIFEENQFIFIFLHMQRSISILSMTSHYFVFSLENVVKTMCSCFSICFDHFNYERG